MKQRSMEDYIVDFVVYVTLIIFCIITIIPFLQVITVSVSPPEIVSSYGLHLFPTKFDFSGYKTVFTHKLLWRSYYNTILRTLTGTILSITLTLMGAYPLSKKYLPNRGFWTGIIVFTMYFSGGLIPKYLLIKNLGLMDTLGALILPGAIGTFNLMVTRNFLMTIPDSIEESARMDGASEMQVLCKIVIPLSKPIIATVALWYGVAHWNAWFDSMLYIQSQSKHVLQLILRQILLEGQVQDLDLDAADVVINTDTMKMAALIIAILPIVCIYPFLQKYFVKGMLVGSLKG